MYEVIDGCRWSGKPRLFRKVFLFGEEGIPLQGNKVINRFTNFPDDQLLIWLMHHENRELVHLDGVVMPLYGDWCFNFWHWCNEILPMALVAHEGGFKGTYLAPANPYAAESLRLLGIRPEQIRIAGDCDYHLDCMCLVPKSRGYDAAEFASRLRVGSILRARKAAGYRLYISRNGSPDTMRKVVDEKALLSLLEPYGFVMLRMEDLSLSEQLSYTCNATTLLGPHGAGMAHCAFMPERSLVIELFAPSYVNPCILLPCRHLRHRYYQVTSNCTYGGYQHGTDIDVQQQILEMTLERELSAI